MLNGDNYNDNFVIFCLLDKDFYFNSQVIIFNCWGDEVYCLGIFYISDWNGNYLGEEFLVDIYFYVVDLGDGIDLFMGYVMI